MFNKNLNAIDNINLKNRLIRLSDEESKAGVTYVVTKSNNYILLKNDVPLDDLTDPVEAVRNHLKSTIKSEMKSSDIIINFGIGIGYLLDETFNTYPSRILVYEPDVKLLKFVLSNVDLSEHLSSGRVYITDNLDELISKLSSIYINKDRVEITYLKNYAILRNKEMLMLTQKVYDTCKSKILDVNTITKFSKKWLVNTLSNISEINEKNAYLLSDLENKFTGQTALIIGAGPSVNDNIEKIQRNRNKFVIFAVNKVVNYLQQNGITPDFTVCLDAGNMDKTLSGATANLYRMNCIADIRADKSIFQKGFNKIFVNFSDTDFLVKKLSQYNSFIKFYESGGTASILALVSAVKLGFSKIALAGIDFAFKDNIVYANGQELQRTSPNEMTVDSVKKQIVSVKSINGGYVQTRDDYKSFILQFETVLKELNYQEVYNLSTFGANIEGTKPAKFEDLTLFDVSNTAILNSVSPFKLKVKEFIEEELYNINNVISIMSKDVFSAELLSSVLKTVLLYQYMQTEVLQALQQNLDSSLAENFMAKAKEAIKVIVETLQKNKLI